MYYLCEEYYKRITVLRYLTLCISWVLGATLLDLQTMDLGAHSGNGMHLYVGNSVCMCVFFLYSFSL